jgi:hypothetical protein
MNRKLELLGLCVCAALAMGAFSAIAAQAETGGHFVGDSEPMVVKGTEGGNHHLHFAVDGGVAIGCQEDSYVALATATATELNLAPNWSKCRTTADGATEFDIEENGCTIRLTVGKTPAAHNTAHFACPEGAGIQIQHPNCTIKIPPQTVTGISYSKSESAITLNSTVTSMTAHHEGGVCVFLGTTHSATFTGSMVVKATTCLGQPAAIAATG